MRKRRGDVRRRHGALGAHGNGHRRMRGKLPAAGTGADERPRGFQSERMREVWQTIDDARDKLGIGAASAATAARRGADTLHGWALASASSWWHAVSGGVLPATWWEAVSGGVVTVFRLAALPMTRIPAVLPWGLLTSGGTCLRRVPLIGGLAARCPEWLARPAWIDNRTRDSG